MKNYTIMNCGKAYTRVSKTEACKAYMAGRTVMVIPCNLIPFTMWHPECIFNRKNREEFATDETGVKNDFNNLVTSFEYYNCINSETGKYAAFYLEEEDWNKEAAV